MDVGDVLIPEQNRLCIVGCNVQEKHMQLPEGKLTTV